MNDSSKLCSYDISLSYADNYDKGPFFNGELRSRPKPTSTITLFDQNLNSRLGVAAGPLLNSRWCKLYAQLGFDLPVYKTVRSISRASHPAPNCLYLNAPSPFSADDLNQNITASHDANEIEKISITNSFGVPSPEPGIWMRDVELGNQSMGKGQLMIVSVNGTPGLKERSLEEDYAYVASLAKEAGAKTIEVNYSCPNLGGSKEGQLFADPENSARISKKIRQAIGSTPFMIKLGWMPAEQLKHVVHANRPYVDGFAAINTIPRKILDTRGHQALEGEGRAISGTCGYAIGELALQCTQSLVDIREQMHDDFVICSVGGMMTANDLQQRLDLGADLVMSATAAMWDPYLANKFHSQLSSFSA
ncbi:hypothetical protein [Agaribacterium sp. ZY112]|uniref:hypothetical protein n=1 Tax=Agaribacterium sp. ZY112 TaxID=3233574 RepID=UPI003523C7D1